MIKIWGVTIHGFVSSKKNERPHPDRVTAKAGTERAHKSRIEKHVQVLTDQMAKRLAPHLGIDFYSLKLGHTKLAVKNSMERFNEIPEAYLNEISVTTKVATVLKALHDLLENEEIPTEIRQLATKTAYKLVTITEGKISENAKIQGRDYFGRKKRS